MFAVLAPEPLEPGSPKALAVAANAAVAMNVSSEFLAPHLWNLYQGDQQEGAVPCLHESSPRTTATTRAWTTRRRACRRVQCPLRCRQFQSREAPRWCSARGFPSCPSAATGHGTSCSGFRKRPQLLGSCLRGGSLPSKQGKCHVLPSADKNTPPERASALVEAYTSEFTNFDSSRGGKAVRPGTTTATPSCSPTEGRRSSCAPSCRTTCSRRSA